MTDEERAREIVEPHTTHPEPVVHDACARVMIEDIAAALAAERERTINECAEAVRYLDTPAMCAKFENAIRALGDK